MNAVGTLVTNGWDEDTYKLIDPVGRRNLEWRLKGGTGTRNQNS
jgi:hypothetical protein